MITKKKKIFIISALAFFLFVGNVHQVKAVMPPDFIFNIGSQLLQIFSIVFLFISAFFGVLYRYIRMKFVTIRISKYFLIGAIVLLFISLGAATYVYGSYKQKNEYEKWLADSEKYAKELASQSANLSEDETEEFNKDDPDLLNTDSANKEEIIKVVKNTKEIDSDGDGLSDKEERETYFTDPLSVDTDGDGYNDKTEIDNNYDPLSVQPTEDALKALDKNNEFIKSYYYNIGSGNLEEAYQMSKQSVVFNVFNSWYKNTTDVRMDKIVRIDNEKSSLELTLFEGGSYIRYGVLMTLLLEGGEPVRVKDSEVRILEQGRVVKKENGDKNIDVVVSDDKDIEEYEFFEKNKGTNLIIGNEEFESFINQDSKDYVVLDAREDLEYNNGNFSNSLHIRFADLRAGRWIEVPNDRSVIVLCWSGIRGKEVAEFLRTKKIIASYLEDGAKGWYDYGGKWNGNILFADKYSEDRYRLVFSTDDVKKKEKDGVVLVDCREPSKFDQSHIPGSINIPIMHTPTISVAETFAQVPQGSKVITVCDGYVNCFDAKITGVELEARGYIFLGRYNRPWEY